MSASALSAAPVAALPATASTASTAPASRQTQAILASTKQKIEIEELDAAIGRLARHMNACNYSLMVMLREFDERAGWAKWGFTDAQSWLRWRCDLSANAARDKLRVAHALKKLPRMSKSFESGALSYSKVRSLTRIADIKNELELIEMASKLSVASVEAHCRQRINTTKAATANANKAHENRGLRLWRNERTGLMDLFIELTFEEGALFEQAVEKAAMQLNSDNAKVPDRIQDKDDSWHALQADAAMLIIREFLSGACGAESTDHSNTESSNETSNEPCDGAASAVNSNSCKHGSTADLYQVVVHVDEQALINGAGDREHATSSSELPIDTVRRLCCDGSIVPIIENAKGEPLNVGRKVRTITTGIRRALWSRDKGCAFPGCECKRYVDAHHIKHWADGGDTSLDNLVLLCTKHHRLVHEGGYSIETDHDQQRFFRRRDGRVVPECGYRQDDWQDDYSANVSLGEFGHIEAYGAHVDTSTSDDGVADSRGVYKLSLNAQMADRALSENSREFFRGLDLCVLNA